MDGRRFDELTRALGSPGSRRVFLRGILGAGLAAAGLGRLAGTEAAAQVSQAQCGNVSCKNNPAKCAAGCVCCAYGNGNTRCTAPGSCSGTPTCPPGKVADPDLGCVDCLTADHCPGPTGGNPCLVAACIAGKCSSQPGNIGATCGQPTCDSGAVTSYACISDGTCSPSSPTSCDPYTCAGDGIGCRSTCAGDGDCVLGAFCRAGQCLGDLGLGTTCTANNQCLSGFCTNGVCCNAASCGNCQICNNLGNCAAAADGALCTPSDTCFVEGRCTAGGACVAVGAPRACEPVECQVGFCQSSACQYRPVEGEPTCGEGGDCFAMACRGGSCQAVGINETQSCSGGTECEPNYCVSGNCQPDPSRVNDSLCAGGRGRCYEGSCCIGATEDGICAVEFGTCCADAPCCGSSCCNDCFLEPSTSGGPDTYFCCPATSLCPSDDPNASLCCYSNEDCLETTNGFGCIDSERNCNGTVCDADCCNGVCCGDGQICIGQACADLPTTCTDNNQCPTGSTCVGIEYEIDPEEGPVLATSGSCCPANRACPNLAYQGPGTGSVNYCVAYGFRCDSTGATCDNAYYVECGNCVNCSPRGSRTRL